MTAEGPFGLYVHWPFCQAKCPYCDFNSHVAAAIDQRAWARALCDGLRHAAAQTPGARLSSLFFGGGTPSLMAPETVAEVIATARSLWPLAPDPEITLEANPTSVEAGRFAAYRDAGVNRVSLGVQALNDADLRALGRLHDAAQARAALAIARRTFDRVSFDLICARQNQTLAAWRAELAEALALAGDHLSLYQLTIEPGTAFADRLARGGLHGLPDEDRAADMYEATIDACAAAGLHQYEVSNFARPGAECRHNLVYWTGAPYAGVGPGAHGRLDIGGQRIATTQEPRPDRWLAAMQAGTPPEQRQPLSREEQLSEALIMGLRLTEGLARSRLRALGGEDAAFLDRAGDLAGMGLLVIDETHLRPTRQGMMLLDGVIRHLSGAAPT